MQVLVRKIKEKKEFSGIPNEFVQAILTKVLNKYRLKTDLKKSDAKLIIKECRAQLRLFTGRFQISQKLDLSKKEDIEKLLKKHSSTKERINFYPALKSRINSLKIGSILDLGCGLNPIAIASPGIFYYASDINQSNLNLVEKFFKMQNISGETFIYDLTNPEKELPKADLCLLFKVLDIIENKGHKLAKRILKKINSKYLVVSFATKKLSGKPMNHPRRFWFEKILLHFQWKFETFSSNNEIFYLIYR